MNISEMGRIAKDLLAQEQDASVMGGTSLGSFLRLSSEWVVFISLEAYRGPLTLNLKRDSSDLKRLPPPAPFSREGRMAGNRAHTRGGALSVSPMSGILTGSSAQIYIGRIVFPTSGLVINTWQSKIWEAPQSEGSRLLPPTERNARLEDVARQVLAGKKPSSLGSLLPVLLGFEPESNANGNMFYPLLRGLGRSLGDSTPAMAESIEAFFGLGTGLTPSGDDLVLGLLLALNRWGHALAPNLDIEALNRAVLPRAYRKTTLLAANLIECASRGQADERLLLALDGIVTGAPDVTTCAAHLSGWGNSSGLDALVGLALALSK